MKVSIIEPLEVSEEKVREEFSDLNVEVEYYSTVPGDQSELVSRCKGAEIIVLVNHELPGEVIGELDSTELISVSFTGYDHVDIEAAREKDIAVTNVPEYASDSVAELVFGFLISLARSLRICDKMVRGEVEKKRKEIKGTEIKEKTLGVIGTGKIGSRVAELGKNFGMNVLAYSNSVNEEISDFVDYLSLNKVLEKSDIITLHVPLYKETEGMIGQKELNKIGDGSILINAARAGVIDREAFIDAVEDGGIKFGVDVLHNDLPKTVLESENVICAPHIGYYTEEALERRLDTTVKNIEKFLEGKTQNRVV